MRLLCLLALLAVGCTDDAPVGPQPTLNSLPPDSLEPIDRSELVLPRDSEPVPDDALAPESDLIPDAGLAPEGVLAPAGGLIP